jgi:hypothetical protein
MNPGQRMKMLDDKKRMLMDKNDEYKELIEKRATAEYEYNVAFATKLTELRMNDTPVTIAEKLTKGHKTVAKLKLTLEIQLGVERACLESMKDIREGLGADRSILTWLREEKGQN